MKQSFSSPQPLRLLASGFALLLATQPGWSQGSLTPPAGPPVASMKSLEEVEPRIALSYDTTPGDANSQFQITQPGSYYVSGSMTVSSGRSFVEIAASNVTLDLSGCRLAGNAGSLSGIVLLAGVSNVRLLNGTLANFDQDGISAGQANGVSIRHVTVTDVGGAAFRVGPAGEIADCLAVNAGNLGFNLSAGAVAERCTARGSGTGGGFYAGVASRLTRCTASQGQGTGFFASSDVALVACTSVSNLLNGVTANVGSTAVRVMDCTISANGTRGLEATAGCILKGNSIRSFSDNSHVLLTGKGNRFEDNSTYGTGIALSLSVGATDNIIVANWHYSTSGVAGWSGVNAANNQVGPIVTSLGNIAEPSAWENFSR